jgi:hypothetical protein
VPWSLMSKRVEFVRQEGHEGPCFAGPGGWWRSTGDSGHILIIPFGVVCLTRWEWVYSMSVPQKLFKVIFELLVPPSILAWLFLKYPEIFDALIPWMALAWLWYLTWDLLLQGHAVRAFGGKMIERQGRMIWLYGFLIGGTISTVYLWSINRGMVALVAEHSKYEASQKPAASEQHHEPQKPGTPAVNPIPNANPPSKPVAVIRGGPPDSGPQPPKPVKPHPELPTAKIEQEPPPAKKQEAAPAVPPLRRSIEVQAEMLWSWITQTAAETKVNEMWLSQIFQRVLDNNPGGPDVDVPAALRYLDSKGEVEILEISHRKYPTWWGETFQEDIRFKIKNSASGSSPQESIKDSKSTRQEKSSQSKALESHSTFSVTNPSGSIINQDSTVNAPQTVNNYGPPPAKITAWEQKPAQWQEAGGLVPETQLTITIDRSMEIPAFAVKCDRPCKVREAVVFGAYNKVNYLTTKDPNISGAVFLSPRPLGAGMRVEYRVRAQDGSLPNILGVSTISPEQLK